MMETELQRWYCFTTQPKREHIAATSIRVRAGIVTLCPRLSYRKKTRRGIVRFIEPVFPGYVFALCDIDLHLRYVLAMQGVKNIVKYGDRIPFLPPGFAEELDRLFPDDIKELKDPELEPGQEILLTEGPFKELSAIVHSYTPAKNRIKVMLEFLGRDVTLEVNPMDVILPDYKPKSEIS